MSATPTDAPNGDGVRPGSIDARVEDGIAWVTIDNPARRNAVSLDMWRQMLAVLERLREDAAVRVLVLKGAGEKAFASGSDISRFAAERASPDDALAYSATNEEVFNRLEAWPRPTIAMIRGHCIGGGLNLSLACDLRICSPDARFALPAARIGLGYSLDCLRRFVQAVGHDQTKAMLYSAEAIDANRALAMGLVTRLVPADDLLREVHAEAMRFAANAPLTIAAVKLALTELARRGEQADSEACARAVQACAASLDYAEGRRAALEKRTPAFLGR